MTTFAESFCLLKNEGIQKGRLEVKKRDDLPDFADFLGFNNTRRKPHFTKATKA
jgi:hypothetical protein